MRVFQELGSDVERRWRDVSYDEQPFPRIATEAIRNAHLLERVDPWEVVSWVQTTTEMPRQPDPKAIFGDPPITVYFGPRFYIDMYFWLDGTTVIHQHAFCGAFQVLLGGSLHTKFRFKVERELSSRFRAGKLETVNVELLERGDTRPIIASDRYIHSLFHLEHPSVTLVVRTAESPSGAPQFTYLKPGFAFDPFFNDALAMRRLQTVNLLIAVGHTRTDEMICELIESSDFATAFRVLELFLDSVAHSPIELAMGISTGLDRFQALLDVARQRHGVLVDMIVPVLEEARRQNNIINRRSQITEAEHRFFLALLLNLDDRETLLELVAKRFPEIDPVEKILDWMDELTTTRMFGSHEANVLGVANYDDHYRIVLHGLLSGLSLDAIKAEFAEEFPDEYTDETIEKLATLFDTIPNELIFSAIFQKVDNRTSALSAPRE